MVLDLFLSRSFITTGPERGGGHFGKRVHLVSEAHLSHDGKRIYFMSSRSGKPAVEILT
jgi:hypothetical protein